MAESGRNKDRAGRESESRGDDEVGDNERPRVIPTSLVAERLGRLELPVLDVERLKSLVDRPPSLTSKASVAHDGRHVPLVLLLVRHQGRPRGGVPARLLHPDGVVLDHGATDANGMIVLRFPQLLHADHEHDPGTEADRARGTLELGRAVSEAVEVPAGQQHLVHAVDLDELSAAELKELLGAEGVSDTATDVVAGATDTVADTFEVADGEGGSAVAAPSADEVIGRLPADFTPELCDAVTRLLPTTADPIFSRVPGVDPGDFRTRRTPILKRLSIERFGDPSLSQPPGAATTGVAASQGKAAPGRYLVRLRQEWRFLTYTIGELSGVDALDPGTVLQQTTETVERTAQETARELRKQIAWATSKLQQNLNEVKRLRNIVAQATTASTENIASGMRGPSVAVTGDVGASVGSGWGWTAAGAAVGGAVAGPAGAVVGGALGTFVGGLFGADHDVSVGGSAGVSVDPGSAVPTSTTQTIETTAGTLDDLDSSLKVNSLVQSASEQANEAVREAVNSIRSLQSAAGTTVDRVSPLLSRVTNLLRWTIYENYMVCTHVEDVLQIHELRITEPADWGQRPLFSDQDIVEYRPFFEPVLLATHLRPQFNVLAQRVARHSAVVRHATFVVDLQMPSVPGTLLSALGGAPLATLTLTLGGRTVSIPLGPGHVVRQGTVQMDPIALDSPGEVRLTLDATPVAAALAGFNPVMGPLLQGISLSVRRLRLWFEQSTSQPPHVDENLDAELRVNLDNPTRTTVRSFRTPSQPSQDVENPLTRHVNRNRTYYFGVLLRAALALPSLRDDAPQLASFRSDSPLWRLPIIGVEGDKVLLLADADSDAPEVKRLVEDTGAATIVQLAAPGQYAEALQGLLQLDDALGRVHPLLEAPPAPAVPPLALIDLAGKKIELVDEPLPPVP